MAGIPATARRGVGKVYTPAAIARRMVCACLDSWQATATSEPGADAQPACRVLDPACGDGAFLLAAFEELLRRHFASNRSPEERLGIVREHLFGADIDKLAVESLRSQLFDRIDPPGSLTAQVGDVLAQNFRCGNSLTGADFSVPGQRLLNLDLSESHDPPDAVSWAVDFPAAASVGGFDMIIGNPPYVRERSAKALFDGLATGELGRRWREARMDLWYYFLHRSLDLLRPGGVLSFIVSSYWLSSRGAGRLIDRLRRETQFEEIELLDDAPVFKSVAGRHMIFRLRKRAPESDRQSDSPPISNGGLCRVSTATEPRPFTLLHDDLFQNGRLVVAKLDSEPNLLRGGELLGTSFVTRQGIAENPPCITRRLHQEFVGRYRLGAGVFVLTADELAVLNLSPLEQTLLRPYYDTRAVRRFHMPEWHTHQILYVTRQTAPSLDEFPSVRAHLEQYRPILERRREVSLGRCAWWHLHWPRDEQIFLQPKIFSVQMGQRPQFVFCGRPAFVGFSINAILPGEQPACSLEALTGILNSELALAWFSRHAKRRGVNLEINAHLLREFPLPERNPQIEEQIGGLVVRRQAGAGDCCAADLEQEIEVLVRQIYERG
ncbi:MAG: Eco57I restriction-modification methylase domain-containing protein [Planctomycetia bacterium]|nr:Eco57I restriction-modification methylase domain-containing protein [Planctomycetia bacterium]